MYGKIFEEIFDSSLMAVGGWLPTYIFMSMISMADKEGFVRKDPRTLYRKLGLNIDDRVSFPEFLDAVEVLEAEDLYSNLTNKKGCRITPLRLTDDIENRGWLIVNYIHYRDKGGSIELRRNQDAKRQRKKRDREKCHVTVIPSHTESGYTDTDTDTDIKTKRSVFPEKLNLPFWENYIEYRKQNKKKKLKSESESLLILWLIKQGDYEKQQKIIEQTIRNGWTGLFEIKGVENGTYQKSRAQRVNETFDKLATEAIKHEGNEDDLDISNL